MRTLHRFRLSVPVVYTALALALTGCGAGSGGPPGSRPGGSAGSPGSGGGKATILLDWVPNPDHISLYLAQEKGYFTQQGVDVKLQPPSSTSDAAKMVSLGNVDLAVSYEPDTLVARSKGMKVTAVAALIPTPLNSLIISGKSGVVDPAGLKGMKVGSPGFGASDAFLRTIVEHNGLNSDDVRLVNVNAGLVPAMLSGKVDAIIGAYRNVEGIQLADEGIDPKIFPVGDAGVPVYDELVVIANSDKLKSDQAYQKTVRAFLAGLAKGDADAQADPKAALKAIQPVAKGYSGPQLGRMVDATTALLKNPGGFGAMDVARWQSFADWMLTNKMISAKLDVSTALSTDYLPR